MKISVIHQPLRGLAKYKQLGFTLVELIAVLVIVGIVSVIGSQFIVSAIDSYSDSERRSKMISRGRASIEQITRQLRNALPNSVRVSGTGNCLEYLPIMTGANYLNPVADSVNNAPLTTAITTAPFNVGSRSPSYVVIGAMLPNDIYVATLPAAKATAGTLSAGIHSSVPLGTSHRFIRNSINGRLFLTDSPNRFCLMGGGLYQYGDYGMDSVLTDSDPGGSRTLLLAEDVSTNTQAFLLSPGVEERNTAVIIALTFSERGDQVALDGKVLVRNVP